MKKPFFIAFEGIDGSGKSTQIKLLTERLKQNNHPIELTCEPTKSQIGQTIRRSFSGENPLQEPTIAALFLADRLEHILNPNDGILSFINNGVSVLSDRYYFSSYSYHSVHVPMDWVIECNKKCADFLRPDLTIFIDILPEDSMNRILSRNEKIETYETLENLIAVRNNYFKAFEILKKEENISIISGNDTIENISNKIWDEIQPYI